MNVSYRNLMSSQKLTNNSTHFSFLVLLCVNKNSLKDFSVLKLLILIYVLNLKHRCFCCSNATEIAFLEMNVLACMPRNMLHSWWYVTCIKTLVYPGVVASSLCISLWLDVAIGWCQVASQSDELIWFVNKSKVLNSVF